MADMFRSLRRSLLCLCILCGLIGMVPAWADTIVAAKRIDLPGATLQDVTAQLAPGADPNTVKISLHASKADFPSLGWRKVGLTLQGNLRRDPQMRWLFDGTAQFSGAPGGALSNATIALVMDGSANTLEVDAAQGAIHIGAALPLDQPSHAQINVHNLPAGWLQAYWQRFGRGMLLAENWTQNSRSMYGTTASNHPAMSPRLISNTPRLPAMSPRTGWQGVRVSRWMQRVGRRNLH
jgi:hypothetical protein